MAESLILATHGDASEPLEFADCPLDPRPKFVAVFREKAPSPL
jgi:hypothetical protein